MDVGTNFIHEAISKDLEDKVYTKVQTRFPPEPNGYLHIGHAKAICIDFGAAIKYNGTCNLRFDDTNPTKEDTEYVDSIMEDIKWLGFQWDNVYYASDYFDELHKCAIRLIELGKAYVDDLNAEEIREYRGTLTRPGKDSPYRNRSVEENLDLFRRMTAGEFATGEKVLRAKIDMASPNLNMRDPVIYRILHATHHRTGDKWCVYPMYDFAHPISDTLEGVTHSLCSLEFEDHRPLYDWFLKELGFENPSRQIEFARLNLNYTLTSKRKCLKLVKENIVSGWNDPRMSTLCGMRRRGYTPDAIKDFCERIGVAKANSVVDFALLEHCVREDLNKKAPRAMAVLRPLKVIIDNYPEGLTEEIEVDINPENPDAGKRTVTFSRELYIEEDDFMEEPPKKYFRLSPNSEVRLKGAYYVTCTSYKKDETGRITEIHCSYDPQSKGGQSPDGRKVKGTLHWVSAEHSIDAQVRLYDRLFNVENPSSEENEGGFLDNLNPQSMVTLTNCKMENSLKNAKAGDTFQFLRHGYFCVDTDSNSDKLIFNRTVALKDSWAKVNK
ncbi:MAG: glutamine--tRNA ligase/YqeY domain fusion protein [Clostridia bacterium]|nr:glutamine--tRNA ligase/YqeY domain fusion protein [Clostridia bacterium]